jgi:glycosyltransferase involved in cell wall biosynthesis
MKMCAALARRGHHVVLVAKRGDEDTGRAVDDHDFYRVERSFAIDKIARPAARGGGIVYAAGVAAAIVRRRRWADLAYCRDPVAALIATQLGIPVVFEAHGVPSSPWIRRALARALRRPRAAGVVAISDALRRDLADVALCDPARPVVVAHDASDPPVSARVRRPVGDRPTVGYVGSLYPGRGVEMIVELARRMPACRYVVVGGTERDIAHWRDAGVPPNVELVGFRPQAELPALYAGFDVVVMPHAAAGVLGATGASDISRWTSPMKMFEYMASGVPLVASDLPVLQEVLRDGDNALIARAGDVAAWQRAIERLITDDGLRDRLATAARADLERHYTWDARAAVVMTGLGLE